MYLLNHDKIKQAVADEASGLKIGDFDEQFLQHTYYYFRLGETFHLQGEDGGWYPQLPLTHSRTLTVGSHECVRVQSLEDFALGERFFAILGGITDMALAGLSVLHGPFVDPHYPRPKGALPLKFAIVNHSRAPVELKLGDRIGKIAFFEISDTYPVIFQHASLAAEVYRDRSTEP